MIWTEFELARLNEEYFAGSSMAVCDQRSGNHCRTSKGTGNARYRAILRLVWGWAGGSDDSGVLWEPSKEQRRDRRGMPYTAEEMGMVCDIDERAKTLTTLKAAALTDEYIAALLNRDVHEIDLIRQATARPGNGTLGVL